MHITDHPEYARYLRHREAWQGCRDAVAQWRASNEPIAVERYGLCWSYEAARSFVAALTQLFQDYNRVLWERFAYCRECGGQCCVVDASDVRPFDLIASALLDIPAPALPERIEAGQRACIYLSATAGRPHCSWPDAWRTIKCWSFYCLGSGPWPPDADLGRLYRALTAELQAVVRRQMPEPLRKYEAVEQVDLALSLDDPVGFSEQFHHALEQIFVEPFQARYPLGEAAQTAGLDQRAVMAPNIFLIDEEAFAFIAEALAEIAESPAASPGEEFSREQLLADLETLAWLVESRPAKYREQLRNLQRRYAGAPVTTLRHRMKEQLQKLEYGLRLDSPL